MKLLFESFRNYALLTEEQLLIEGRIDDAAKKYPELAQKREELDGESLLDALIAADPSGNQKYLMGAARIVQRSIDHAEKTAGYEPFWGKQWPAAAGDNLYSPWGQAQNIADLLPRYHKGMPYLHGHDERFRDINNIKTYATLSGVVTGAERRKKAREEEKKRKAALDKRAAETTDFIDKTPYHIIRRPMSHEACIKLGKTKGYCISQPDTEYYQQYTGEGKMFYFVDSLTLPKPPEPSGLTIVLQYETGRGRWAGDPEYEMAWDNENNQWNYEELLRGLGQSMLGWEASEAMLSVEAEETYDLPEEEVRNLVTKLEELTGQPGPDPDENAEKIIMSLYKDFISNVVEPYTQEMFANVEEHARDNPAGPKLEDYEELLNQYDFAHMHVSLDDPSETGASDMAWHYNFGVDVEEIVLKNTQRLKWKIAKDDLEAREDELFEIVRDALHDNNVYPEELEKDWGSDLIFNASSNWGSGTLGDFEHFLEEAESEEKEISDSVPDDILEKLLEAGFLGRDEREEEYWPDPEVQKQQQTLPFQESRRRIKVRIIRG